jgi:fumarate hydratase class II
MDDEIARRFEDSTGVEAGLYAIALGLYRVANEIKWLGNGDAATTMGAIEALGVHLGEKFDGISNALSFLEPD